MEHPERRIDRILADGYADGLEQRTDAELRAMRGECSEVETDLSYIRGSPRPGSRSSGPRSTGAVGGSLEDLIAALPGSSAPTAPDRRRPTRASSNASRRPTSWSCVAGSKVCLRRHPLVNPPRPRDRRDRDPDREAAHLEDDVSGKRRRLHRFLDAVDGEIAARVRDVASPGTAPALMVADGIEALLRDLRVHPRPAPRDQLSLAS